VRANMSHLGWSGTQQGRWVSNGEEPPWGVTRGRHLCMEVHRAKWHWPRPGASCLLTMPVKSRAVCAK